MTPPADPNRLNVSPTLLTRTGSREEHPGQPAAGEDRGAADDQGEQQHVPDRIDEIDGDPQRGADAERGHDRVEGEGCADGRGAEAGDGTVEPRGGEQPV